MSLNTWENKLYKTPISKLKLWLDNPRLSSEIKPKTDTEYAEIFIYNNDEKKDFLDLVKSIAINGFKPFESVMVWKEDQSYCVAEGNRRVLAIKLLLKPANAPESIKKKIEELSASIKDKETLKNIYVIVAPTFNDTEWYINQRNNLSSLKKSWTRRSQVKWIYDLYNKHNKDITIICDKTEMTKGNVYQAIRLHEIFKFFDNPVVVSKLSLEEYKIASSYSFPVTALERFILTKETQEKWGITYNNADVIINSNKRSFLNAFAELIKLIVTYERDTRNLSKEEVSTLLLEPRFTVSFEHNDNEDETNGTTDNNEHKTKEETPHAQETEEKEEKDPNTPIKPKIKSVPLINNPQRKNIITKKLKKLATSNPRLNDLFEELKALEINKHENCVAACLRVLLDLSVWEYIRRNKISQHIVESIKPTPGGIDKVTLDQKIEYLSKHLNNAAAKKIATDIRKKDNNGSYTMQVLNAYVHGESNHFIDQQFLNKFWDYLFPLFEELLNIQKK